MRYVEIANGIVWGVPALILILGTGIYLSFQTEFAQIRMLPKALLRFFKKSDHSDAAGVSPFQAFCTALAATVGTGNIVGVAGAILLGGPGAVFWMWVSGLFGMMTKFAEATLSVFYRSKDSGIFLGGPMYMIRNGLPEKWHFLGRLYCFFGVFASFGIGNAAQINAVVTAVNQAISNYGVQLSARRNLGIGLLLAVSIGLVLLGGFRRIGTVAQYLVPLAAGGYLLLCVWVLFLRIDAIPEAISMILKGAFSPRAVMGGSFGSLIGTLRCGVSRGVFTNEAGMGTAGIAHSSAIVDHPVQQGLMGIVEVFVDTIVICTVTALAILCSGISIPYGEDVGAVLTSQAFSSVLGHYAAATLAVALCLFAFATVIGWGFYGLRCAQYLFGPRVWKPLCACQIFIAVAASVMDTNFIWSVSELLNGLMAIPNLIALLMLSPTLVKLVHEYQNK